MGESAPASSFDWVEAYDGQLYTPLTTKRKMRTRKVEFVGWGSMALIGLLESLAMDTTKTISQHEVADIVNKYVNDHNLHQPTKKKRILCDQALLSLFGRKTISRIRIYDLLETHFAENQVDSDDDFFFSSDENDNACHRQKTSETKTFCKKRVLDAPKSRFAAIVPDDIKLIYLKRSLVLKLLKDPETFECKIVGSFVRIKSDPNDYLQKNSHLLVQVLGLKKGSETNEKSAEILLQVSNFMKDVGISMLSDVTFSKEECEDLCQRVRNGLLNRPTIVEFEQKVQVLHEDITNHWLCGELALLQKLIDRANEKGWRKELAQSVYLEKRQLLQTPQERIRLLHDVPKVIADEIEVEATPQDFPDINQGSDSSPKSTLVGASEIPLCDATVNKTSSIWISFNKDSAECEHFLVKELEKQPTEIRRERYGGTLPLKVEESNNSLGSIDLEVIDLSDDDEDPNGVEILDCDPESYIWHYVDPQGDMQGPFSMTTLKRRKDRDYFPPDFRVWKTGQTQTEAVLLIDILQRLFPSQF